MSKPVIVPPPPTPAAAAMVPKRPSARAQGITPGWKTASQPMSITALFAGGATNSTASRPEPREPTCKSPAILILETQENDTDVVNLKSLSPPRKDEEYPPAKRHREK